jgi:hypothetical protein
MHGLVLEVQDCANLTHWRWVLKNRRGGFLGDHDVNLDPRDAEYEARHVLWRRVAPGTRGEEKAELLRIGRSAASKVFGSLTNHVDLCISNRQGRCACRGGRAGT